MAGTPHQDRSLGLLVNFQSVTKKTYFPNKKYQNALFFQQNIFNLILSTVFYH